MADSESLTDFVERQRHDMDWTRMLERIRTNKALVSGKLAPLLAGEAIDQGLVKQGNLGAISPEVRMLMPGVRDVATPGGARRTFEAEQFDPQAFSPLVEALLLGNPDAALADEARGALGRADPAELNAMASKLMTQSGEMQPGETLADVLARGDESVRQRAKARFAGFR